MARGQTTDAIAAFEHCVHLQPGSTAWFELGSARHQLLTSYDGIDATAITSAVEAYTKALSICSSKRDDICSRCAHTRGRGRSSLTRTRTDARTHAHARPPWAAAHHALVVLLLLWKSHTV